MPSESKKASIKHAYTYHAPKPGQQEKYVALREKGKELAYLVEEFRELIVHLTPVSFEQATALNMLAMTEVQVRTVVMWANASIATEK